VHEVTENTVEVAPDGKPRQELRKEQVRDYLTDEQKKRDESTTELYEQFVESHKDKQTFSKESKQSILALCRWWISGIIAACIMLSFYILVCTDRQASDIVALISAIVPLLLALVGTLNIITQNVFPHDEDVHLTKLMTQIHENDLKNKIENMKGSKEPETAD